MTLDNSIVNISIAVTGIPINLPINVIDKSNVKMQVQGGIIRFRFNNTVDINNGMIANIGDLIVLESVTEAQNFSAITISGTPVLEIIAK